MNRIVSLLFVLAAGAPAWATLPPSVFVDSQPLGARIAVDGTLIAERTPALLRGLADGPHRITVTLEGYSSADQTVTVAAGPPAEVTVDLTPPEVRFSLPSGAPSAYSFERLGTDLVATPLFPDEPLAVLAGWGLATLTAASLVSTAVDVYRSRKYGSTDVGPVTVGLWVSTVLDLPWVLALQERRARFARETPPRVLPWETVAVAGQEPFDAGERALAAGNLDLAAQNFARVVETTPPSRLVPGAWFRLARIHAATGRQELAVQEYRLVADTLPQAAYHDRARKALADWYEAQGKAAEALAQLDLVVLNQEYVTEADVQAQRARLVAREATVAP